MRGALRWRVFTVGLAAGLALGPRQLEAALPPGWPGYADAVVAADGSGQFRSVQAAIFAAPTASREKPWVIFVKAGVYKERLYVQREKRFLWLVGEDPEKTVITYDLHAGLLGPDGLPIGTFRTPTALIDADDFTAKNLTFENSAGPVGQALAVRVDGDRVAFRGCRFVGWQDTILVNRGRHYFEDCFISGHVDFIFGGATAFFERCRILVRGAGYVTAASTPEAQPYGFVFSHCAITGETPELRTYLGRPWRGYASVAFLATEMSEVVRPEGWHNWDQPRRERTVRYSEYASTGPGAAHAPRVPWARRLDEDGAAVLSAGAVLRGTDGWDPRAEPTAASEAKADAKPAEAPSPSCPAPARFLPNLSYDKAGGQALLLDACIPAGKGTHPAVLLVHGGGWMSGDKAEAAQTLVRPFTEGGFAWFSINYRLAPKDRYPAQVEDVEAAIRWVRRNAKGYKVDPERLALLGESAGGHLAALAAVRMTEATRLAAVVPFFAPVDLESDTERRGGLSASLRALFGQTEVDESMKQILRDASPIQHVRAGLPPFLLVHGTADMSVPYEQSRRMQQRLKDVGVAADLITIPDGTHGTKGWAKLDTTYEGKVVEWTRAHLAPKGRP